MPFRRNHFSKDEEVILIAKKATAQARDGGFTWSLQEADGKKCGVVVDLYRRQITKKAYT